jgi:hypothetical protein
VREKGEVERKGIRQEETRSRERLAGGKRIKVTGVGEVGRPQQTRRRSESESGAAGE